MQNIECEDYKDFDLTKFFDADVIEILMQHNNEHDRERVNTVLRALFA